MLQSETEEELLQAQAQPPLCSQLSSRRVGAALGALACLGCFAFVSGRRDVSVTDVGHMLGFSEKTVGWVDLGAGTACRLGPNDHTLIPEKGDTTLGAGGKHACKKLCENEKKCQGAEYRISEDRCELWYQEVRGHEHLFLENTVRGEPDFICMLREPKCVDLKKHFKIFKDFVVQLNGYHHDSCPFGAVADLADKCSMKYAEEVLKAHQRICDAIKQTCNVQSCAAGEK